MVAAPGTDTAVKFTLRFHNRRTHELLGLVADRLGVSKNELAEEMLERELDAAALLLEQDLAGTLELLRSYRRDDRLEQDIEAVAHAEGYEQDPLKARRVQAPAIADAHGIGAMFTGS